MKFVAVLFLVLVLSACESSGGNNSGSESAAPNPCVANLAPVEDEVLFARDEGYLWSDQEQFFDDNAMREGVVILESGLQYKVLREGCGDQPSTNSLVAVNYHGTLLDGEVFDSSYERGQPTAFTVSGVIDGWVEALPLMSEGDIWVLYIPSDLAYGENSRGEIPAGAALIFTVELLYF